MGTLSGIRVVEFEGWIAGSLLGLLLADQGADVIRIARPGSPIYDNSGSAMLARGKRSLVLDLKIEADRTVALKLASTAEIVIENLRPGVLDDLGLGAELLRTYNTRLIHIRLPGFASDDLSHAGLAAYEPIIAASVGMFSELNLIKPLFGMDPVYTPLALPSIYGAVQGAIACNAALLARDQTGKGASLEVPLAAAAAMAMSSIFMRVERAPAHYDTPKLPKIVKAAVLPMLRRYWRNSPARQQRFYTKIQSNVPAMMSAYPCADGRLFYVFAIDHAGLAGKVLDILGLRQEAEAYGFVTANPYDGPTDAPNLAATASLPPKAQAWLRTKLGNALLARAAFEWEQIFADADLPATAVRTTSEWMQWPPLEACEAVIKAEGLLQPGRQCWFDGEETVAVGLAPTRDQHATALRAEAAAITLNGPIPVQPQSSAWQPLAGVKVLDFSSMVAGPVASRTLAELGAEVIKVESPQPQHGPRMTCWYGLDVNQGKPSILVALKSTDGRSVAAKLIQDATVVLHNFTPAAAKRLGLDQPSLERLNPDILVCNIAAYGGPVASAIDDRHGYDPVLQMASGIAARYGSAESPELHGIASSIDNLTGYSAAFAIVTALAANKRGQKIRTVKTSLVQAANLIQFPFCLDQDAREPNGQLAMGEDGRTRLWRTRDGWMFTAIGGTVQAKAFDAIASPEAFQKMTTVDAVSRMRHAGIAAVVVKRAADLRQAFSRGEHSIGAIRRQIQGLSVEQLTPDYVRADGVRLPSIPAAQKPGGSTQSILSGLGFTELAINSLIDSRSVAVQLSQDFLP
jgi:crotonobetainyl-CoA:carnitine CoA-transferase CaiB-like acyl-CoA transferase